MKRITIAAGALLLSTSAFAFTPSSAPVAKSDKAPIAISHAKAPATLLVAKSNDLPKADLASADLQSAPADTAGKPVDADPDLDLAEVPSPDTDKGMGGPIEEETIAAPEAGTYPPCKPGPGDDHCIQLYEPGVRAALASWTPRETDTILAGEMGGASTPIVDETGVGGPYEPVEASAELAMNGDGVVDAATGETDEIEIASGSGN